MSLIESSPTLGTLMPHTAHVTLADHSLRRVAYGALHLTQGHGWGPAINQDLARELLSQVARSGINYIDTADTLGPGTSESVLGQNKDLTAGALIGTKAGMVRAAEGSWGILGRPDYLKQQAHASRLRLGVDTIELFFLHRIDPTVPVSDQLDALLELRAEGVIRHFGVSEPTLEQLEQILDVEAPAAVESHYNIAHRWNDPVVELAASHQIPFIGYWTLGGPFLSAEQWVSIVEVLQPRADARSISVHQLLIAWVLSRHTNLIALVGSRNPEHVEAASAAVDVELSIDEVGELASAVDAALGGPLTRPTAR